jgi:hypothetical protein
MGNTLSDFKVFLRSVFVTSTLDFGIKMASLNPTPMEPAEMVKSYLVKPEEYGFKLRLSAKLKLSPLDQNMPRLYGSRWILCFPLPSGVDNTHV